MDYDFGTGDIDDLSPIDKKQNEVLLENQRRIESMVKDPKWVPLLEMIEQRIDFYKSMQWIQPSMTNEQIGEKALVGATVINELEGVLNEIRAVAGATAPKSAKRNKSVRTAKASKKSSK